MMIFRSNDSFSNHSFTKNAHLLKRHIDRRKDRTLDIFHVASTVTIQAKRFLTLDERQSKLALLAGLQIENFMK